ncbi:CLUMA_CG018931, isoform A [Clunio marinus]|uniref:Lysophospholipid acyltransferase 5 n=1 Tax=Clunio marinus TaxID=568069 RepID=A0A1J1J0S3_9DIPT|nr:CLUMA_CG018931, isoform A [Clunio marinus]
MLISWLSRLLTVPEPALRLLFSVLISYPIVICYRNFLHKNSSFTRNHTNLLFTICGITICIFNYGFEVYHSLIAVTYTYLIINLLYNTKYLVPASFLFHMIYLLMGYYKTSTENYDICWTMCHCVMVLHLIGLTFDVSDSVKNPEVLGLDDNRPVKIPNLLEVFAFAYFPPTVIIGPQFSFKRYSNFLDDKFDGKQNMEHGFKRFLTGAFYLGFYQFLTFVVPDGYFMTPEFENTNFFYKLLLVSIWGRCTLYKYISCWILSEGAAICCGLTFVSRDEKTGIEDWSGCANIKLRVFEDTYSFGDYVASFNVQTNLWVFQYIYKRLKFLNNRNISHISALLFLAVWHGFHSGYYMTFFMEFLLIHFEKEITPVFKKNPKFQRVADTIPIKAAIFIVCKLYTFIIAGYCLIPFAYLGFYKWWNIYKKFYFIGHIVILPMSIVWKPLIVKAVKICFPLEKKPVEVTANEKDEALNNDRNVNEHEKTN